jgi:hypothetical protein
MDIASTPGAAPGFLPILDAAPGRGDRAGWAAEHREDIEGLVAGHGAVLFRGLGVTSAAEVVEVTAALGIERMAEREGFAPRDSYAEAVYSASKWPAGDQMCMHNELSYASEVPGRIVFGCLKAAAKGGNTEIADGQAVLKALPSDLADRFAAEGWLLTRNYFEAGIPWSTAFGTQDQTEVTAYCATTGIDHEWLPDGQLRTRQHCAAVVRHPRTGALVWFNQVAFLNEQTMDPLIRDYLVSVYGPEGLPFNTAYGDGSRLTVETVERINEAYQSVAFGEPWQDGDILLVDNIRMAHSRAPYQGERDVVVILGNPCHF